MLADAQRSYYVHQQRAIITFARHVLGAARVRENWFSGLTKHSPALSGAGLGANAFTCIYLRQLLPARELPTASLWRGGCRGTGMEPRRPAARAHPTPSRLNDAAFFSRSVRSRSRASGARRRRARRYRGPKSLQAGGWRLEDHARRRGGGGSSRSPVGRQSPR